MVSIRVHDAGKIHLACHLVRAYRSTYLQLLGMHIRMLAQQGYIRRTYITSGSSSQQHRSPATMEQSEYTRASMAERFSDFILRDVKLSSHVLGAGSFGEVVLASWGGTVCAAKRLHKVFSTLLPESATGSVIKRYLQECKTWSQLRHPGIVLFLGVVFESGESHLPLLVMEKMDTSLLHFVESRTKASLSLRHKANILLQVACAMTYLHGKNLVHRDLTPNNILIDELSIKAKVTDFGLTRVAADSRMATKSAAGTPTFMPPEALSIEPRHDSKLDVFSFGNLILFTTTHKWPMPDANVRAELQWLAKQST